MVKKLTNEQIRNHWDELKQGIMAAFQTVPRDTGLWGMQMLEQLLSDKASLWVGLDDKATIVATVMTSFVSDPFSLEKHLVIYSLYGYNKIPEDIWKDGVEVLSQYAKDKSCTKVVAYSNVPRVIEFCEKYQANVDVRYIQWEV